MLQQRSIQSSQSLRDKILSFDYILIISILVLGIISMFAMYSTDGGEFKYHTKSHILRFFIFFGMFFVVSFIQVRFWHSQSYLIYILFFILLLGVKYFGLTSLFILIYYFFSGVNFLPAIAIAFPFLVLALHLVLWPLTGNFFLCRDPL